MSDKALTIDALTPRQQAAAMLLATGMYSDNVVAERIGIHPNRLCVMKSSQLFQVFVRKCRERLMEKGLDAAVESLMKDAPTNVNRLIKFADGDFHDAKAAAVQVRAAEILFKRQVPEQKVVQTDSTTRIIVQRDDAARLDAVLGEDDVVDVTPVEPKSFEQFEAEWQDEESGEE